MPCILPETYLKDTLGWINTFDKHIYKNIFEIFV